MPDSLANPVRRALLQGNFDCRKSFPVYPPWSLPADQFVEKCSQCNQCITVCPSKILIKNISGYPETCFDSAECIFCRKCLDACPSHALVDQVRPWTHTACINKQCLTLTGIACQSCVEMCEARAIKTRLTASGIGIPEIDPQLCTGCGACYQVCPTDAVQFNQETLET